MSISLFRILFIRSSTVGSQEVTRIFVGSNGSVIRSAPSSSCSASMSSSSPIKAALSPLCLSAGDLTRDIDILSPPNSSLVDCRTDQNSIRSRVARTIILGSRCNTEKLSRSRRRQPERVRQLH